MNEKKHYLGIGKTKFNSSVCLIPFNDLSQVQIWQTERLTRKKDSGAWPSVALSEMELFKSQKNIKELKIAENRDVETPIFFEDFYNENFPFYDFLGKKKLNEFSRKFNSQIKFITHHEAHAYAALTMSPFEKSIIVVMDGAGNRAQEFDPLLRNNIDDEDLEECTVYLQNGPHLEVVLKRWIKFVKNQSQGNHLFSNGIGYFYEKASEYIFRSSTSAGKVMGLAPLGDPETVANRLEFQARLNWKNSFSGETKKEWEDSIHFKSYFDLAATVQQELEKDYQSLLISLKQKFPTYENIILTGGCALNCTNNARILESKVFNKIYVLPFPGDESISLGLACQMHYQANPQLWKPLGFEKQNAYLGPILSCPNEVKLIQILETKNINFLFSEDIISHALADLIDGKIIGWFQGRSESGPRALGNRSILARPDRKGLKDYLNSGIKFRESFRPYGCSVTHENASKYFEVDSGFDNPYMSYALRVRSQYKEMLNEVSHTDGTSRMQTVRESQNPMFYQLISRFGKATNLYCLLNTSLNVMGEPIVETMEDAVDFFEKTNVDGMYIGNIKLIRN
jgi:carbamoyltransferase